MKTLTVFTPTYNRRELLGRVYESLSSQTSNDFVWMIVDDGSTDGTESEVEKFISEGKVDVEYYKKENGGKHTAINLAFEKVATPLIAACLDSDDKFTPDAVEKILDLYEKSGKKYRGYVFPRGDAEGNFLGDVFDPELTVDSWRHAVSAGRFSGETVIVLDSSFAKKYRFPVIEGERFFTEGYVWLQMTEDFLWSHDVICVGEYLDDGFTKSITKVFASSPVSHMMYNNLRLSIWKPFLKRFKFAAYYDGFAMLSHEKRFISKASSRPMALAALPFGAAFCLILKLKK